MLKDGVPILFFSVLWFIMPLFDSNNTSTLHLLHGAECVTASLGYNEIANSMIPVTVAVFVGPILVAGGIPSRVAQVNRRHCGALCSDQTMPPKGKRTSSAAHDATVERIKGLRHDAQQQMSKLRSELKKDRQICCHMCHSCCAL